MTLLSRAARAFALVLAPLVMVQPLLAGQAAQAPQDAAPAARGALAHRACRRMAGLPWSSIGLRVTRSIGKWVVRRDGQWAALLRFRSNGCAAAGRVSTRGGGGCRTLHEEAPNRALPTCWNIFAVPARESKLFSAMAERRLANGSAWGRLSAAIPMPKPARAYGLTSSYIPDINDAKLSEASSCLSGIESVNRCLDDENVAAERRIVLDRNARAWRCRAAHGRSLRGAPLSLPDNGSPPVNPYSGI